MRGSASVRSKAAPLVLAAVLLSTFPTAAVAQADLGQATSDAGDAPAPSSGRRIAGEVKTVDGPGGAGGVGGPQRAEHIVVRVPADDPIIEYELTNLGGTMAKARLLVDRYAREAVPPLPGVPEDKIAAGPMDLVTTWSPRYLPYRVVFSKLEVAAGLVRVARRGVDGRIAGGWLLRPDDPATLEVDRAVTTGDEVLLTAPEAIAGTYAVTDIDGRGGLKLEGANELPDTAGVRYTVQRKGALDELMASDDQFVRVSPEPGLPLSYVWPDPRTDTSPVFIEKRFDLGQQPYELELTVTIHNISGERVSHRHGLSIYGWQHPELKGGGILDYPTSLAAGACFTGDGLERHEFTSLVDEQGGVAFGTPTSWAGVDTRYFIQAAIPLSYSNAQCALRASPIGVVEATLWTTQVVEIDASSHGCLPDWMPPAEGRMTCADAAAAFGKDAGASRSEIRKAFAVARIDAEGADLERLEAAHRALEGRQQSVYRYRLYDGPKEIDRLVLSSALRAPGADHGDGGGSAYLEQSLDFGWFGFIGQPLHHLLRWLYSIFGSYALAIILMTVAIKLILLPLTNKSFAQMQKMQKLKPKMDALKERHGSDREAMNRETMALYKREKVNPLGGCLPMLLQMPIWIALYRTIYSAVELYHTPLGLWVQDLSAPDPYYVMPIILGFLMLAQSFFTPTAGVGDPTQQKIMRYGMPVMFAFMMLFLPAGLVLYILVNTVLTLLQNLIIRRRMA